MFKRLCESPENNSMMLTFDVENGIPGDGGGEACSQRQINHIAVNELSVGNYLPGNFQHLLRLINGRETKTLIHDVPGNRCAGATTQIKNPGSWWQAFKHQVDITQDSVYVGLPSKVGMPLLGDMIVGILHL